MSEIIIQANNLSKIYRLYAKPHYKFLDMFGLLRNKPGRYSEHHALRDISLSINRGEKIAFIGRNGAGKSTLLKLFTKVIEPTSGDLKIRGKVNALLQIGTGFHPDFTGRENVFSFLAQLGIDGERAQDMFEEIVSFSELEEYIDQPVKTYSTGMGTRLMFAASTMFAPEILVLDEILGVGDAYFSGKSFDRMRKMCEAEGTTLLLVTHDIYSALKICDRMIWIDGGRVVMDGEGAVIVKAYEDSIREQEERRLRLQKQRKLKQLGVGKGELRAVVELQSLGNVPLDSPVIVGKVALAYNERIVAEVPLSQDYSPEMERRSHVIRDNGLWGDVADAGGRSGRTMLNFGSQFHKVASVLAAEFNESRPAIKELSLLIETYSDRHYSLAVKAFIDNETFDLGVIEGSPNQWNHFMQTLCPDDVHQVTGGGVALPEQKNISGRVGAGDVVVNRLDVYGKGDETKLVFRHKEQFRLRVEYQVNKKGEEIRVQMLIAFHRNGSQDVLRVLSQDMLFDGSTSNTGVAEVVIDQLPLGVGNYDVTLMLVEAGYFDKPQEVFYSLNPSVYASIAKFCEIKVEGDGVVENGTIVVGKALFKLVSGSIPSRVGDVDRGL